MIARLSICIGTVLLWTILATGAGLTQGTANTQSGRQIFEAHCAVCHGSNGEGGIGPSLRQIATRRSFDEMISFIENPLGPMPKLYPETLSAAQVRDVTAYIRQGFGARGAANAPSYGASGMGPGMMHGMMYGMMYGYGPGGYGPGMMCGYGNCGYGGHMGPGMMGGPQPGRLNLSVDDVKRYFDRWLTAQNNPRVKLGIVKIKDADTIVAEIVTTIDGSLVVRYEVDRHTGYMVPR